MVTELLIELVLGLVAFLLGLFPDDTVDWPDGQGMGQWVGALVGPLDRMLPLAEIVAVLVVTVTVVMPAMLVYRLAMWLWTILPDSISGSSPS